MAISATPITYTPKQGLTPEGQQVAETSNNTASTMLQPVQQQVMSGQPMTPDQTQGVNQAFNQGSQNLATMATPQAKQSYIDNSAIPAMQSNYEDLAKQLYEFDKTITPSNLNSNPTPAPDAVSSDRVAASPLDLTTGTMGSDKFSFVNPSMAISSQNTQKGNIVDLLNLLNSSIGKEFNARRGTYASTVGAQKDVLNSIATIMGLNTNLTMKQAELNMQKTIAGMQMGNERYLKMLELGYVNPDGTPTGVGAGEKGLPSTGADMTADTSVEAERKKMQDQYNSFPPQSPVAQKIADNFQKAHGIPLFPQPFQGGERDGVQGTMDALARVNAALKIVNENPNLPVGLKSWGPVNQALIASGSGYSLADSNVKQLYDYLKPLEGASERSIVGGRLSGYLQNNFKTAFAQIQKNPDDLKRELKMMQSLAENDLQSAAQSHGYSSYLDMPSYKFGTDNFNNKTGAGGAGSPVDFDPLGIRGGK